MSSEFEPVFTRVVVKREKSALERKIEKAGLVATDKTKSDYQSAEGTVIKIGEDCCQQIQKLLGKKVLFAEFSGHDFPKDWFGGDGEHVLIDENDIFGEIV